MASDVTNVAVWLAMALLATYVVATAMGGSGRWEAIRWRAAIATLPVALLIAAFGAGVKTAVALLAAFGAGYGFRSEREQRLRSRPKTLKQLTREQGTKPIRSIDDFPTADPEVFSAEDLDSWDAAIKEARGHE